MRNSPTYTLKTASTGKLASATTALSRRAPTPRIRSTGALSELKLGDYTAAVPDLQHVVAKDPRYDYDRAAGLLADALAKSGQTEAAAAMFERVLLTSTLSETLVNYAEFLKSQGKLAEGREWAQRVLTRKKTLPAYLKRRERPWFRKAAALAK